MGYLLAVLTGIFFGIQGVYSKHLTKQISPTLLTWGMFTFTFPMLLLLLLRQGIPAISWKPFLLSTAASFLINVVAWNLYFRALQLSPVSHTMPFTAFTPAFLIPVAFILLGEMPDMAGFIGIFIIILGAYGIHLNSANFLEPLQSIFRDRGTRFMLLVALLWSISATVEKVAVLNSSPAFYGFTIYFLLALAYLPYIVWKRHENLEVLTGNIRGFVLLGIITGALIFVQFSALRILLVSYVIAFKRAGIVVSVLLAALFFHEKNPVKNLFFAGLMVLGVFLIMI